MAEIVILRRELIGAELRAAAGTTKGARRRQAIALVLEGVDRQTLRGEAGQKTVWGSVFPANARVGQQGTLARIWARHQTPCDARHRRSMGVYLRTNQRAISVFDSYDDIVDACCNAWNVFATDPKVIVSITSRNWAEVS